MIARRARLKRTAIQRRRRRSKPGDNEKYLAFVRTFPCCVCWLRGYNPGYPVSDWRSFSILMKVLPYYSKQASITESAHVGKTRKGMAVTCIDREAIPLCGIGHHREGPESHHKLTARGGAEFFDRHGLDRDALIAELNRRYDEENPA